MNNMEFGRIGEEAARKLLKLKGYEILESNYRGSAGEIDVVAKRDGELSFVEVKTRRNYRYGRPCEAVSREKQRRIREAALNYLREPRNRGGVYKRLHFDVIEVVMEHVEDAF